MKWYHKINEKICLLIGAIICALGLVLLFFNLNTFAAFFLVFGFCVTMFSAFVNGKKRTDAQEQSKQDKHTYTGNLNKEVTKEKTDNLVAQNKSFDGYLYSLDGTDGKTGRKSRQSMCRMIYYKDGEYSFLHPKIVTLDDEESVYAVNVNGEKLGEINGDCYYNIKKDYNKIYDISISIEKEGNSYIAYAKILFCMDSYLSRYPDFHYEPHGLRISSYMAPRFIDEYVVIDLETTGIDPEKDEIIEVAAIHIKNGEKVAQFSELVYSEKINQESISKNHITFDDVKNARKISEVLNDFVAFIKDFILIGHNICFDLSFIRAIKSITNRFDDTCVLAEEYLKNGSGSIYVNNCKLETVCRAFGIKQENSHRALDDCVATYQCYENLKNYINSTSAN